MSIIVNISVFVNFILMLLFLLAYVTEYSLRFGKRREYLSVSILVFLMLYFISLALLTIVGLWHKNLLCGVFPGFILLAFAFGYFATYQTHRRYMVYQIVSLMLSLFILNNFF